MIRVTAPLPFITLALVLGLAACRGGGQVPEAGAVLLHFELADGAPPPDELRLWVYDDSGPLWSDVRIPGEGALPPPQGRDLGTILIQPGASSGTLRIHARGFSGGSRRLDGTLKVPADARGSANLTLELLADLPDDTDGDGIPDPIDDCAAVADPAQTGCSRSDGGADSGTDAASDCPGGRCNLPAGATCGTDGDCAAGFCVDGVCCANACVGPCRSCNQSGAGGLCQPYSNGSDPDQECSGTCNGAGACGAAPSGNKDDGSTCGAASECKSNFCVDGVCCREACDGTCKSCATGTCKEIKLQEDAPNCSYPRICDLRGRCIDLTDL